MKTLAYLLEDCGVKVIVPPLPVAGLSLDTRTLEKGSVFFALKGRSGDGHQYLQTAIAHGAAALVVEEESYSLQSWPVPCIWVPNLAEKLAKIADKFYDFPLEGIVFSGFTGTNGKSTSAYVTAQVYTQIGIPCGFIGTFGVGMGPWETWDKQLHASSGLTTPDIFSLRSYIKQLKEQGAQHICMEVSSHALDQNRIQGIPFTNAVFTNLTRDHLDYHETLEEYAAAKSKLFALPSLKHAILNAEDGCTPQFAAKTPSHAKVWQYGIDLNQAPDFQQVDATIESYGAQGVHFALKGQYETLKIHCPLLGAFNVRNCLAAFTHGLANGLDPQILTHALAQVHPAPGRMQALGMPGTPMVVVDYAHTPDALLKALEALRKHTQGQLWCVFGCGGDRDRGKRPLMGEVAAQYADRIVLTNDNPRKEAPMHIVKEIWEGIGTQKMVDVYLDRAQAIQFALQHASPEDVVLIAGKGHETIQDLGHVKLPHNDVACVLSFLQGVKP